jgi:MFS family permease
MRRIALALAAALALADASIVTLGLPSILVELDATVVGVALVLGVYTAVLAVALLPAAATVGRVGAARLGTLGMALFALASLACGAASSLELLLVLRAVQALGGAATLVACFELLDGGSGRPGRALWVSASVFGTAVGPALGGALTEAFDWQAIFLAQAPIAAAGALAAWTSSEAPIVRTPPPVPPSARAPIAPTLALALVSAALTAVIFLVVLLLVAGWSTEPLVAALAVSVVPAAALAASRIRGDPGTRALVGAVLIGGGIGCLALLPAASPWWTVAPQLLAGAGMGLALPALAGELLPERTRAESARLLSIRHLGIALALVLLAPIVSASLDDSIASAREQGTAVLLDAQLDPQRKIEIAPQLFGDLDTDDPRDELSHSLDSAIAGAEDEQEAAELRAVEGKLDSVVTDAVRSAFRLAFVVTALLALAAAAALVIGGVGELSRARVALAGCAAAAALALAVYSAAFAAEGSDQVELADPCQARDLPDSEGIGGFLQQLSLEALDRAACEFGSSREELLLALFDDELAAEFERDHGADPRSLSELGPALLGL